ncbi:nicotinate-nucleotide adenylyltransferase [Haliea sp. E1-2-M8]|uniref:nicotinate-nucleotide adenylyltransferase n=1 Tax=Haliea sp. E1-2-M8 TaxID=3064706 RepID=UPI0027182180|nr:nicotinate-nucleotide adenylyltransferase [Haliea sp. E1-2-M8]MDO8861714.1 nicotinate-nucleotide adenylyltransferase [Haliea sp. E1-2-M8]
MTATAANASPVAVLGGTFNPIHNGHLRSALELVELLGLERLHLMPCANPPHRQAPGCPAESRADMVERAVAGEARLVCDRRELARSGPSWTVDSLAGLRDEYGPERSLGLVMGCDALLGLERWHRWQALLDYAHIIVIARPGWHLPGAGTVAEWLAQHRMADPDALRARPAGGVLVLELRPLAISSTEIRALCRAGRSARYLLPEPVLDYIETHELYRGTADDN